MTEEELKDKQYQRLIEARNFHYNNLNKWLITFYAIIGALFLALWTLHASATMHRYMELCVAIVGYVVSIGAILSIKGYYYWETNWIMLVHHFEKVNFKTKEDRVYSVFANTSVNNSACCPVSGAHVSTSKVSLAITTFISVVWGMIAIYIGISLLPRFGVEIPSSIFCVMLAFMISCVLTILLMVFGAKKLESDLSNIDNLGLTKENMDKPLIDTK